MEIITAHIGIGEAVIGRRSVAHYRARHQAAEVDAELSVGENRVGQDRIEVRAVRDEHADAGGERDDVPLAGVELADEVRAALFDEDPVEQIGERRRPVGIGADAIALNDVAVFTQQNAPGVVSRNEIALSWQKIADLILCAGDGEAETIVAEIEAGGVGANVITEDLVFVGARLDEVDAVVRVARDHVASGRRVAADHVVSAKLDVNAAGRVGGVPGFRWDRAR